MLKRSKLARVGIKRASGSLGRKPIKKGATGQTSGNKRKPKTLSKYKKEFDAIFSKFIRIRDKDTCYTCGLVMEHNKSQNGHFVPRQYLATRWDERNCNCQCYACNILYNGQPSAYALQLEKQYGKGIVQELESMRKTITKLKEPYYLENIAKYKALVVIHTQTLGQ